MQINLFGEVVDNEAISVEKAAEIAKVSVATIRNWIKTGYLTQIAPKLISYTSFATFMNEVVSVQKLNKRANKLHKKHFFDSFSQEFTEQNNSEVFAQIYENSLTEAYRNQEGIYYTPAWIVEDMLKSVVFSSDATFLEPYCGTGNFIIEAIRKGANPENIYAYDTDPQAITIAKKRIRDMFGVESPHIQVGDFLTEAHKLLSQNILFDFIFTNPPWGKKITKQQQKYYANSYQSYQSQDTSVLFLFACLQLLKEKGILGFLMQEAFANISSYEHARSQVLRQKILRITDYGKAFPKLLTSAYAFIRKQKVL
ncbi:MAG: N-6 DNA methylase [Raineya sp.]|nr:N-6 DNA methylase [Raineya sp.]